MLSPRAVTITGDNVRRSGRATLPTQGECFHVGLSPGAARMPWRQQIKRYTHCRVHTVLHSRRLHTSTFTRGRPPASFMASKAALSSSSTRPSQSPAIVFSTASSLRHASVCTRELTHLGPGWLPMGDNGRTAMRCAQPRPSQRQSEDALRAGCAWLLHAPQAVALSLRSPSHLTAYGTLHPASL